MDPSRVVGDRYELGRLLGAGGMGEVYVATDRQTRQQVAVKLLAAQLAARPALAHETSARFSREIQALGRVTSRHSVSIHDAGFDPETGEQFLVMDLLEGEDLGSVADRLEVLPVDTVLRLAAQTCEGLAVAHAAGIVHRDIKPGNLFLVRPTTAGRIVKILDFGIARVLGEANELTQTGAMLGSPLYMAPEQLRGSKSLDHRADVWSLGVVMYRLLAGRVPHSGDTIGDLIVKVCGEPAPPLREVAPWVPAEVADLVHKTLAIDPAARIPTMQALGGALLKLTRGDTTITDDMLVRFDARLGIALAPTETAIHPPRTAAPSVSPPLAPVKTTGAGRRVSRGLVAGLAVVALAGAGYAGYRVLRSDEAELEVTQPQPPRAWTPSVVPVKPTRPPASAAPLPASLATLEIPYGNEFDDDDGRAAIAWLHAHLGECSPSGYPAVLQRSPPPATPTGESVEIGCAAIAGDLDYARAKLKVRRGTAKFVATHVVAGYARELYLRSNASVLAVELAELALEAEPRNPNMLFVAGTIEYQLGHADFAAVHFKTYLALHPDKKYARIAERILSAIEHPRDCLPKLVDGRDRPLRQPGCPPTPAP